ncbi:MAG: hypothetical protein IK093_18415, partial [Ruminiclostridium sp.]|nr:hypothetical protein [Ruminiclostridium sp.]
IRAKTVKTGRGRMGCIFGISTPEPADFVCRQLADAGIRCGGSMPFPPPPPPPFPPPPPPPFPPRPPRPPRR